MLTGWCPFSLGDMLYVLAAIWLILGIIRLIRYLVYRKRYGLAWLHALLTFVMILVSVYGIFLVFWGFNYRYNRLQGVFGLSPEPYSTSQLIRLCDSLAARTNADHLALTGSDTVATTAFLSFTQIKKDVPVNYRRIAGSVPGLHYRFPSLKPSMFGYLMNYASVTGYFNPFSGEAQVNTTPMPLSLPFTACHEVAHQLGFAKEDDANFVGYLVAATSPDLHFRYAANFEMFLYGINVLSFRKPKMADSLWTTLITRGVQKDYDADFAFYDRFRTSIRPVLNNVYDQYLKANEQTKGIRSYGEVVAILINYVQQKGGLPDRHPLPN